MALEYRNISSTILIFSCIDRVLQLYFEDCPVVFSVNIGYPPKTSSIQYHPELSWKSFFPIKPEIYVIDSTTDDLENIITTLEHRTFFNPAALFILVVDFVNSLIVNTLTKHYIYTFIIIENSKTLYGSNGMEDNSTEPVMIGHCTARTISKIAPRSGAFPRDNLVLEVGIGNSPPFVIQGSRRGPFTGIDIDIVEFISERMKFEIKYEPSQNFVGTKSNVTYNGALGMLARKSAGMVMGGMFATMDSYLDFAISYPIHRTTYSWYVPGPTPIPFWKRILLIYQPSVSLAIFSFYVLMTLLQLAFNRLTLKRTHTFYNEFFKLYSSSSSVPIRIPPTEDCSKKMFYVCWFLFWLILNASFSSKLLESLIQNKYNFPINSMDTLNRVKLEICILRGLEFGLKGYGGKVTTCTECADCLNRTAFQKDLITVRNTDLVDYYKSGYYLSSNGDPLIHSLKEKYFAIYNVMIFRKNHPLYQRFNEMLRRMVTSGIIAHLRHKYSASWDKSPVVKQWKSLELNPLKFIFEFWFFGLILSTLVFATEIIISKHNVSI